MKWIMVRLLPIVLLASASMPATAAFHLWDINEIYSNADGSVQFIEMKTPDSFTANGEHFVSGHRITVTAPTPDNVFTFIGNLPNPPGTRNRTILIATPGFAALPGAVAPDYTLPSRNFFSTAADTLRFDGNAAAVLTFTAGQLPTNGRMSINKSRIPALNSPQNFAGQVGFLSPVTPGDVDGDGDVDRADAALMLANFGRSMSATRMQGDLTGDGRVSLLDAVELQKRLSPVVATATAGVPEPATAGVALAIAAAAGLYVVCRRAARRQLQSRA
jgi:hypothetical protein